MKTKACVLSVLVALALAFAQRVEARSDVYGYVTIWDVAPDQAQSFEARLLQSGNEMVKDNGFINERLLRNIDPLTYHYATYTKSSDRATITIHETPKRSATIPKRGEKNVLVSGICTCPPSASAANRRIATCSATGRA